MRILLVASAFNSLTQRTFAELADRGHQLEVATLAGDAALRDRVLRAAVARHRPDLVVAPMLKSALPADVWSRHTCLIVHPGPPGDRGPSSLDWAIEEGAWGWGVTVLQANAEMDAGAVWAWASCPVPPVGKSDLYRNEVSDAALRALLLAIDRYAAGDWEPHVQRAEAAVVRPYFDQTRRRIDWQHDPTEVVLRKLRAAASQPGVLDQLAGREWYLHGGHAEDELRGAPGELLATRAGAVCRATSDGAVWIPELRARRLPGEPPSVKLPATVALADRIAGLPACPVPPDAPDGRWRDIRYREHGPVGVLSFAFPGGAMSTDQCRRLLAAYRQACTRPTTVLVLGGERDFFSNGIHLGVIEAAADPAQESWDNLNAMDDLVEAVLTTTDRLVVAALGGNAAAGGVMLALAADQVWCRDGAVLNPHYRLMGLYGSEYWTYLLPRRVGATTATRLIDQALPVSAAGAQRLGLADELVTCAPQDFAAEVVERAVRLAGADSVVRARIAAKKAVREADESVRPLAAYRAAELDRMHRIFFDPAASYHQLRRAFVRKEARGAAPVGQRISSPSVAGVPGSAAFGDASKPGVPKAGGDTRTLVSHLPEEATP
ncbi:hydrogenase maturation protein [Kitasatospora sp. RB6PN24]|uniref:hydrogenase maturation protein n=1 Tax=Kitasatospora humi TaxID=2893891 RepID=UPI001E367B26|nr:hydrogenase maturation protein [Kitasatospora humi]MCC9308898.1 hydrogenase maturation protein [Kitasatospora humi]